MTDRKAQKLQIISPIKPREVRNISTGRGIPLRKNEFLCSTPTGQHLPFNFSEGIDHLHRPHSFFRLKKGLQRTALKLQISTNLAKLIIERPQRAAVVIKTSDVVDVENGFSPSLNAELIQNDCFSQAYGFRLITQNRVLELSSNIRQERDRWVSGVKALIKALKEWSSESGLLLYSKRLSKLDSLTSMISKTNQSKELYIKNIEKMSGLEEQSVKDIVMGVLSTLISKVEADDLKRKIREASVCVTENQPEIERENDLIDENYQEILRKNRKIKALSESVEVLQGKIIQLSDSLNWKTLKSKIWGKVIPFLSFKELATLRAASKFYKALVSQYMAHQANWKTLCMESLAPRKLSWHSYMTSFRCVHLPTALYEINCDTLSEIRAYKLPTYNTAVEEVLINLCSFNASLAYCEGMKLVVHFFVKLFKDPKDVIKVMLSLMKPPYHLEELWQKDNRRFCIIMYQAKVLTKLRLPILYRYLKEVNVKLEDIVRPWVYSLFLGLLYNTQAEEESFRCIWDHFIIHGWNGFMSALLALLDMSQYLVLGHNKTEVLKVYREGFPIEDIRKSVRKFEVKQSILADLENAYYMNTAPSQ